MEIKDFQLINIPDNVEKELQRLHDFLLETGQQEHREWAIQRIDHIHRLYLGCAEVKPARIGLPGFFDK